MLVRMTARDEEMRRAVINKDYPLLVEVKQQPARNKKQLFLIQLKLCEESTLNSKPWVFSIFSVQNWCRWFSGETQSCSMTWGREMPRWRSFFPMCRLSGEGDLEAVSQNHNREILLLVGCPGQGERFFFMQLNQNAWWCIFYQKARKTWLWEFVADRKRIQALHLAAKRGEVGTLSRLLDRWTFWWIIWLHWLFLFCHIFPCAVVNFSFQSDQIL